MLQTNPFSFESHSAAPAGIWHRIGQGEAVLRLDRISLRVEESGTWWHAGALSPDRHPFRKTFALDKKAPGTLTVRKFSPDGKELELLTLVREADGRWTSPVPHWCDPDEYRAEIQWEEKNILRISWWSKGPAKNYELHTRYTGMAFLHGWLES